jgi:hypothetical protein
VAEPTWDRLEHPILEAVAELEDQDSSLGLPTLAQQTGLPLEQIRTGVRRLFDTDLLSGIDASTKEGFDAIGLRLRPRGRQTVGQWPASDPTEAFLQLLSQSIAAEEDPVERGRLEKLRDSAGQVSKGVAAGVLTAFVRQVTGLD